MNTKSRLLLMLLFFVISGHSYAQTLPKKLNFGKISTENLKMTTYEADTSANALIIGDFGDMSFDIGGNGLVYKLKKHVRIKILKKEGLDQANIVLSTYESSGDGESISSIKGAVYNLVNGKVVKEKFKPSMVHVEKVTEERTNKKIHLPNVKVGSIIEYSYLLTSSYVYSPDSWVAQKDIPVLVSSFVMRTLNYFEYKVINSRYYQIPELKSEVSTQQIRVNSESQSMTVNIRKWRAENIPAFKPEPLITSPYDYLAKLKIELKSSDFGMKPHTTSWPVVLDDIRRSVYNGTSSISVGFMKDELEAIMAKTEDKTERAVLVYTLIQSRMTWDGDYGRYKSSPLRKSYMDKKGNVVDINLLLIGALNKVGITTSPLYGSTRKYGKIVRGSAEKSQLIYVMAVASIDGNKIILDATSKSTPFGVLPERALNYQGVLMSNNDHINGQFIAINPTVKDDISIRMKMKINPDLGVEGNKIVSYKGYAAIDWREDVNGNDEEEYLTSLEEDVIGLSISDYEKQGASNMYEKAIENYNFEVENVIEKVGDKFIFNPMFLINLSENPFTQEKRLYPVELPYSIDRKYTFQVELPEGFDVVDLPRPQQMVLPNKGGKFRYQIVKNNNLLTFLIDFELNRLVFNTDEYTILKTFFEKAYSIQKMPLELTQIQ
ncbi:DUF3858 domain-containing protein [Flammeovirga kamogawensis]|uniref:DUF3857 domain-containing protein n=1 Tax=Flammeovirga kamogawensis TaxID=373891 RepID=A0ABX8GQD9_9BACT|nr:DUF3858 domain-containing protein [Flammeovirga kamogawensis]MBB6462006.1 hypothetical protein [Flammeovirga kamogawensis]QWG05746.1 DUF3857 domain-containing protein [Flammeovirga kamogawensis]TRX67571.1 DUF3857 domain-containing protein [Flammeovirga kamogawensis]